MTISEAMEKEKVKIITKDEEIIIGKIEEFIPKEDVASEENEILFRTDTDLIGIKESEIENIEGI